MEQVRDWARKASNAEQSQALDKLQYALGGTWDKLLPETQSDLLDASLAAAECKRRNSGWLGPVLTYSVATERELKSTVDAFRRAHLLRPKAPDVREEGLGLLVSALTNLTKFEMEAIKPLPEISEQFFRAENTKRLEDIARIRNRAAHGERATKKDLSAIEQIVSPVSGESKSILLVIVEARPDWHGE
jgi:hypothetical protein